MALTEKDFGKTLPQNLVDHILKHTTRSERAGISRVVNVSASTVRDVAYGYNPLTADNAPAIVELIKVADQNCQDAIGEIKTARKEFKKILE
jgi:hypothetical protein